jgi:hypothetical protein
MGIRERLVRRWPLKLAALALSVLLWAGVASQETTRQLVAIRVELDLPDSLELARPLPSVTALVTGAGHEILKLYRTPITLRVAVPATAAARPFRLHLTPERLLVPLGAAVTVDEVEPRDLYVSLAKTPLPAPR